MSSKTALGVGVCLAAGVALVTALAGPITPPAGPVASTAKPLSDVEPRTVVNATNTPGDSTSLHIISQPGSYYLTGNVAGVAGKHGIVITASGVTLDLRGYEVTGLGAGSGSFDGIRVSGTVYNLTVRSGAVRVWGQAGVNAASAIGARLEGLQAASCLTSGLVAGTNSMVSGCTAYGNAFGGIVAQAGSTITGCSSSNNGTTGISGSAGVTVSSSSAYGNGGTGISTAGAVHGCSAASNATGITLGVGGAAVGCSVVSNSTGIFAQSGAIVEDCMVTQSAVDGIMCGNDCTIRGNSVYGQGSAVTATGIHVTTADNRIEGNNCTYASRGIKVDFAGNFITRNICRNNPTNYDVVAGNVILVVQSVATGAVSGGSGGASAGSVDPNANFTY